MSRGSEAVKRWRANTKRRIIEAMGGKCAVCLYDRCDSALELHHLDPNEKELSLGGIRANPTAWHKIVEELRKCVLLCANCHREVHAQVLTLPSILPAFDENLATYREASAQEGGAICPVCSGPMLSMNRTCSTKCAATRKGTIDWSQHDVLTMITHMTMEQIAVEVGCSAGAVWKRLRKVRRDAS